MARKFSATVRNAMADAYETAIGASAVMKIFTGAPPTNLSDADSGTLLATLNLPSDWMAAASGGVKAKSGTWEDTSADGTGTAGYFRLYSSGGTCHDQGTITATGGGGDMTVDNTSFATGQAFTVSTFSITMGNA